MNNLKELFYAIKISKIVLFFIFFLFIPLVCSALPCEDYLWLESNNEIKEADSSVTQPLCIYYGRFPGEKGSIKEIDTLEAFHASGYKDSQGKDLYNRVKIEDKDGVACILINSKKAGWHEVVITGSKNVGSFKYGYSAATTFFLFPEKTSFKIKNNRTAAESVSLPLNIEIFRGRVKEEFSYNRDRAFPIRAVIHYQGVPFKNKTIKIVNYLGSTKFIKTDNYGNFVYFPNRIKIYDSNNQEIVNPKLNKLLSPETIGGKSDQDLIIVESKLNDSEFRATYSIFYGNKGPRPKKGSQNVPVGLGIFFLFLTLTLMLIVRFKKDRL